MDGGGGWGVGGGGGGVGGVEVGGWGGGGVGVGGWGGGGGIYVKCNALDTIWAKNYTERTSDVLLIISYIMWQSLKRHHDIYISSVHILQIVSDNATYRMYIGWNHLIIYRLCQLLLLLWLEAISNIQKVQPYYIMPNSARPMEVTIKYGKNQIRTEGSVAE